MGVTAIIMGKILTRAVCITSITHDSEKISICHYRQMKRPLLFITKDCLHLLIVGLPCDFHAHEQGKGVLSEAGQSHSALLVPSGP